TTPPQSSATNNEPAKTDAGKVPQELVIDQIKKCVVFLTGSYDVTRVEVVAGRSTSRLVPAQSMGTGFIVGVPEPRMGPDRVFAYLVTNKHVVREPDAAGRTGNGPYFKSINMRINTKQARPDGTELVTVALRVVSDAGDLEWLV